MVNYRLFIQGLSLLMFFFVGCTAKKKLLEDIDSDIHKYQSTVLCGELSEIEILDNRVGISQNELDIPFISWPGQESEIRPPLTQRQRDTVYFELQQRTTGAGDSYSLDVAIIEGVQRFEADWRSEKEHVKWEIEMILQNPDGIVSASSEVDYFARSMDASNKYATELYNKTFRLGILSAFSKTINTIPDYSANCVDRSKQYQAQ